MPGAEAARVTAFNANDDSTSSSASSSKSNVRVDIRENKAYMERQEDSINGSPTCSHGSFESRGPPR